MMYPFMTLNDGTEIVHSDMITNGTVKAGRAGQALPLLAKNDINIIEID